MTEEAVKKELRKLITKTVKRLDKENYCCGPAMGKLADVATAMAKDKGVTKIVKSVYGLISKNELEKLLFFNEFSEREPCIIEIWFWEPRQHEPFKRKKLFYNQPEQRIGDDLKRFIK